LRISQFSFAFGAFVVAVFLSAIPARALLLRLIGEKSSFFTFFAFGAFVVEILSSLPL